MAPRVCVTDSRLSSASRYHVGSFLHAFSYCQRHLRATIFMIGYSEDLFSRRYFVHVHATVTQGLMHRTNTCTKYLLVASPLDASWCVHFFFLFFNLQWRVFIQFQNYGLNFNGSNLVYAKWHCESFRCWALI